MIKNLYKNNKRKSILLFFSGFIVGLLSVIPMVLVQKVIDSLYLEEKYLFIKFVVFYVLIYITADLLHIFVFNWGSKFELRLNRDIKDKVVKRILDTTMSDLEKCGKSNIFNVIVDDLKELDGKLVKLMLGISFSFSAFIIGSIITISYDYVMLIIMLLISIIASSTIKRILLKSENAVKDSQNQRLILTNILYDIITGTRDIRLFSKRKSFLNEFSEENKNLVVYDKKILRIKNSSEVSVSFIFNLIMAVILLIGGFRVYYGDLSVGSLVAIIMYTSMITDPIFQVVDNQKELSTFKNAIKRLDDILGNMNADENVYVSDFDKVELKNIFLEYGDNCVFKDFNLVFHKGDKIKFHGKTGSGKSTLAKLITGLYKPTSGEILVDDKTGIFVQVSAVFQENKLFNLPIIDNITFKSTVDEERLHQIIKICRLEEVIEKYQSNNIGFDTSSLSGGEKTRVLLARALLINSELYILDEISTGLDEKLFYDIFDDVINYLGEKTVIVIDHKKINDEYFDAVICV